MQYAVFGLGDTSYAKYNFPAKKLFKRLQNLGAKPILPRGDGDDQHYLGYDGTLDPWLQNLWNVLLEKYPIPTNLEIIPDDVLPEPSFRISFLEGSDLTIGQNSEQSSMHGLEMTLKSNERITRSDHFQDIRHVILESTDLKLSYQPGDVAVLRPHNLATDVRDFLDLMQWAKIADTPFILLPQSEDRPIPSHWPRTSTLRGLLTHHLDVFSTPRRSFFEFLAYFANDPMQKEKLREFSRPEGQDELYSYNQRPRRTIFEVLSDFHSVQIPLDYIIDVFPEIRPRQYSISSALRKHPNQIHLTVAIVLYKTMLQKERIGVCSKWIESLHPGDTIRVGIAKGTMKLPASIHTPAIFIGPGTGVAPVRSMIQERTLDKANDNVLFFGCRYKECDYVYADEWQEYEQQGMLEHHTAFSRDTPQKVYVQDILRRESKRVWEALSPIGRGVLYLSGSAEKMPTDVEKALRDIFQTEGDMSVEEAEAYLGLLERSRRYQQECWT